MIFILFVWCITSTKPLKANKRHRSPYFVLSRALQTTLQRAVYNLPGESNVPKIYMLYLRAFKPEGMIPPPFCEAKRHIVHTTHALAPQFNTLW